MGVSTQPVEERLTVSPLEEEPMRQSAEVDPTKLLDFAKRQTKVKQPTEHHRRADNDKSSSVVVDKRYLGRLELENDLYRQHLDRYEAGVASRLLALVETALNEPRETAEATDGQSRAIKRSEEDANPGEAVNGNKPQRKKTKIGHEGKEALEITGYSFSPT